VTAVVEGVVVLFCCEDVEEEEGDGLCCCLMEEGVKGTDIDADDAEEGGEVGLGAWPPTAGEDEEEGRESKSKRGVGEDVDPTEREKGE